MLLSVAAAAVAGAIALLFLLNLTFSCLCEDVRFVLRASKFGLKLMKIYLTKRVLTVLDRFAQRVEANPHKTFLLFEGRPYTYRAVDSRSNRVAQVFLQQQPGLRAGDTVALLMNNEPDFVCVWFGLSKLGCAVAFLNTNLRTRSLLHCLVSSGAKTLVVGADLVDIVEDILTDIQNNNISVWVMGKSCTLHEVNTLADKVEEAPDSPVPGSWKSAIYLKSTFLYIFTSGTTGATLVLKKKFSASQFWNDCRKYNVTVVQYIGELCRYLCNQPKIEGEKNHQVRMAVGNGIRTEVWKEFLERFGNIKMCEFYGATEGNIFFMNYTGKLGAVGRTSYLYKAFLSYRLVKYDAQKETPIRNEQGRCEKVGKGETGLLISPVTKLNPFSGYAGSKKFSQQKLLEDVFKKGDLYFNTGDLMSESQDGYIYFRDRIGDTFRWKGENVATTEVAEIIGMMDFVEEANVYGVAIKGYEGRIGMAAIILKPVQEFDGKKLYDHVVKYLPSYAYPRFLRIQESMEMTGTFKRKKINLVEEAFNPMIITEPLYFLDPSVKSYILMTEQIYNQILSLKIKL
ncbi:long-chain fatty acid transport protein 6 isoform X2 [Carcharodon carcharias]|uniref:long-chain fatty acid transport protein 6 isoform X2 n=1 Tax=Carcharodon carcharias TaxID=13397 RepID=UPI001B7DF45B|nr:long-chain fatty acid transport protein 6 isoform X2 [Carcharodon carcharias]